MADYLKLENNKLVLNEITELVTSPDCGAISIFVGKYLEKNLFYFCL
jgi:hypothetical protein